MHTRVAPLLVRVNDRFRIAMSAVHVPGRFELCAHVPVVVDLAVVGHPDRAGLVRQRLMPAGQVDDAEPPMGKRCLGVGVKPGAVWAAVGHDVAHRDRASAVVRSQLIAGDDTGNATHGQAAFTKRCPSRGRTSSRSKLSLPMIAPTSGYFFESVTSGPL